MTGPYELFEIEKVISSVLSVGGAIGDGKIELCSGLGNLLISGSLNISVYSRAESIPTWT